MPMSGARRRSSTNALGLTTIEIEAFLDNIGQLRSPIDKSAKVFDPTEGI
jgi:hypothetical protein